MSEPQQEVPAPLRVHPRRKKALLTLGAVVAVAGIAWGGYEWLVASHYENTDNAYVQGNVIQITPQVGGTVMSIHADDTDFVRAGQPLVKLDPADARVALDQAEAALGQTVRQVRTVYANNGSLAAQVALREADVQKALAAQARAQDDYKRRASLVGTGAISGEELNHAETELNAARSAVNAAQAAVVGAREQLAGNQAMTSGTDVEQHPQVQAAAAKVREAWLAQQARRAGGAGRRLRGQAHRAAGTADRGGSPLMSIIPLNQVWVEANFKEVQLRKLRIGQPVTLTADLYGKKVEYQGRVAGLGVGTGAAFSLLPAQNATGNWIKVVQRVPVRVALDPVQLKDHPLRVGLSMEATVDVGRQDGKTLADAPRAAAVTQTQMFDTQDDGAEAEVRRVIAQNSAPGRLAVHGGPPAR
jgi:membrane fusion protein (multidrug efflux system)